MGNNSAKNVKKLQKLCPKWKITEFYGDIYIKSEYFYGPMIGQSINNSVHINNSVPIDNIIDIYNSIDIITNFLSLNGFKRLQDLTYCYSNGEINISIISYFSYSLTFAKYMHRWICSYSSSELIEKLREILDLDSLSKLVINNE